MISEIPQNLNAYEEHITEFLIKFTNLTEEMKSYRINLLRFYKEISETEMHMIIFKASISIKNAELLYNDISEFRNFVPFYLKIHFDRFLTKYKINFDKEKASYLEIESRIISLLKNMSSVHNHFITDVEFDHNESIDEVVNFPSDKINLELNETSISNFDNIEKKIKTIDTMFKEMSSLVENSKSNIDDIDSKVNATNSMVSKASYNIISAAKYKAALIPIGTSLVGALVGGPIGLCIGLKTGLIGSVIGALCGGVTGKVVKNYKNKEISDSEKLLDKFK